MSDLQTLFEHTLMDVYFAERQIVKTLPTLAKTAKSPELKAAFTAHLAQTKKHVERLESVFEELGRKPKAVECEAIKGILKEGDEVVEKFAATEALDAGMIAAAQAVEHYEIARYGALKTWAEELGMESAAELLGETLDEEEDTDRLLTEIAESSVNQEAS